MTNAESEFNRELEVFGLEVDEAIQYFYCWLTVNSVARGDSRIYRLFNQHATFWNAATDALQTSSLIVLGRIFDLDSDTHNVSRLLKIAQDNRGIFSKDALAERKRRGSANADEWLDDYLRNVYVPKDDDFRRLRRYLAARRKIYEDSYQKLRGKVVAHRVRIDKFDGNALVGKGGIKELQELLVFLQRLHEALWMLFFNGTKPNLRPARRSVRSMRARPRPGSSKMQEDITSATDQFLKSLVAG